MTIISDQFVFGDIQRASGARATINRRRPPRNSRNFAGTSSAYCKKKKSRRVSSLQTRARKRAHSLGSKNSMTKTGAFPVWTKLCSIATTRACRRACCRRRRHRRVFASFVRSENCTLVSSYRRRRSRCVSPKICLKQNCNRVSAA